MAPGSPAWMSIKAALGGGESVLHVAGLDEPIAPRFPQSEIVELAVSRGGLDALTRDVSGEHRRDAQGRAIRLQRGRYGESWFYAGRSTYSLHETCNP